MRTIIKKTIPIIIGVIAIAKTAAQDIHFSQYYMAPLLLNPSLSGAMNDLEIDINYKDQWRSVGSPYSTIGAGINMRLNKKRPETGYWAAGLNFFNDKAGDSKMGTMQGNLSVAYHLLTGKNSTLGAGFQLGFDQRSINYSVLQWANQYDGSSYNSALPSGETNAGENYVFMDMGAGIVWAYNKSEKYMSGNDQCKAHLGVAVFHPHQPNYSFFSAGAERLYAKWTGHGNLLLGINNTNLSVMPGFMYVRQGPLQEIYAGTMFKYLLKESSRYTGFVKGAAFSLGGYYRFKDALAVMGLLEFSNYSIGISYDINISGLTKASSGRGGVELALRFVTPNPFKGRTTRAQFN